MNWCGRQDSNLHEVWPMRSAFRASDNLFHAIACERLGDFRINCLGGVLGLVLLIVVVVWLVGGGHI